MSTHDMNPEDDARLEAFLRREDELSKLLQELPQQQPSAELDAAILADAEAALAQDAAHAAEATPAANDPAFPGGAQRPSFLTRWKLPLSMAAAALLTVSLVWMQQGGLDGDGPIQVAQAPAPVPVPVPTPAATPALEAAAPPPLQERNDEAKLADAGAATTAPAKPKAVQKKSIAKATDQPQADKQATQLAQADQLPPLAKMQASPKAYAAPEPTVIAKADISDTPEYASRGRIVTRSIVAAPAPAAPAASAAPPAPSMAAGQAQEQAAAKAEAQAEAKAATARKENSVTPPQAWLKRIEEKIGAGSEREALEEWAKFRKAYPDYEVPKPLLEKIERLKK